MTCEKAFTFHHKNWKKWENGKIAINIETIGGILIPQIFYAVSLMFVLMSWNTFFFTYFSEQLLNSYCVHAEWTHSHARDSSGMSVTFCIDWAILLMSTNIYWAFIMCKQKFSTLRKWLLSGDINGDKYPLFWKNEGCHWVWGPENRESFHLKLVHDTGGIIQVCFVWMEFKSQTKTKSCHFGAFYCSLIWGLPWPEVSWVGNWRGFKITLWDGKSYLSGHRPWKEASAHIHVRLLLLILWKHSQSMHGLSSLT